MRVKPEGIPDGSRFKGYHTFTVYGLNFEPRNVLYKMEVWRTPDGKVLIGKMPGGVNVLGGHFSTTLVSYIYYQHHECHVPHALICKGLQDIGVPISKSQINHILLKHSTLFHEEKETLLKVGLEVSSHIHVDDTGARHNGKNGYCTHIGNEWFAYFSSTESKSRINFLKLLRAGQTDYVLDENALEYMFGQKLPKAILKKLREQKAETLLDENAFNEALKKWGITRKRHRRIVTEGCLIGCILSHGINPKLAIMSDDAGQFNVLMHALCWIHAERLLAKLIGFNEEQKAALDTKRTEVWTLYRALKAYKSNPNEGTKKRLEKRFDYIFSGDTCFASLNAALKRLYQNKSELLLVLERTDLPLHNNLSENDIREYVMRRQRNGSTRSDLGRRCRDTFASLKKTCRKLGISFWHYLNDRFSGSNTIPALSDIIRQRVQEVKI